MQYWGSLKRYTSTLAALDTFINRRITLLNPLAWADRNDRELMDLDASTTPRRVAFAYCMAEGNETAHHWQVFADRGFGVCIAAIRRSLSKRFRSIPLLSTAR
ncbi:hypothetical protein C8J43_101712 [Sphingomonas sp. PP-CE-1G-424]|nr:hypothetical protein C8J43_101712 [Sphingomonas sp. PP-CE-1G-424]